MPFDRARLFTAIWPITWLSTSNFSFSVNFVFYDPNSFSMMKIEKYLRTKSSKNSILHIHSKFQKNRIKITKICFIYPHPTPIGPPYGGFLFAADPQCFGISCSTVWGLLSSKKKKNRFFGHLGRLKPGGPIKYIEKGFFMYIY